LPELARKNCQVLPLFSKPFCGQEISERSAENFVKEIHFEEIVEALTFAMMTLVRSNGALGLNVAFVLL
jgi:hypothetical protein